jgi:hypothetical protein
MTPNAERETPLIVAQMVCGYVYALDKSHWGPTIPYPCTQCMNIAERIIDVAQIDGSER